MAIADEEMQDQLRDVEDDQATASGDVEGYQHARDERRASENGPSSENETLGVMLLPGRDAIAQQANDESVPESDNQTPSTVQPSEELVRSAASYVLFLDAKKHALYSTTRGLIKSDD
jgi:hypothetical protein